MKVCVVGHGPSLKGAKLGKQIDACDKVVRLKNCQMLLAEPHNYGKKTDVMCSSTEVMTNMHKVKASEYWGAPKALTHNQARIENFRRRVKGEVLVFQELMDLWNAFFLELGGKHKNVSTGLAAVIISLDRYKPDTVVLAGFDKVLNPSSEGYQCTVPTPFNDDGRRDTGHDWQTELAMLPYLGAAYEAEIVSIDSRYHFRP